MNEVFKSGFTVPSTAEVRATASAAVAEALLTLGNIA
jgi:hypothetical protein